MFTSNADAAQWLRQTAEQARQQGERLMAAGLAQEAQSALEHAGKLRACAERMEKTDD